MLEIASAVAGGQAWCHDCVFSIVLLAREVVRVWRDDLGSMPCMVGVLVPERVLHVQLKSSRCP